MGIKNKPLYDGRYGILLSQGTKGGWRGDFTVIGGTKRTLSPKLAGEGSSAAGVKDLDEARRIAGVHARALKLAMDK